MPLFLFGVSAFRSFPDKLVFVRKAAHPLPPSQARGARGVRNSPTNTNLSGKLSEIDKRYK